jgi:hypothetical protein
MSLCRAAGAHAFKNLPPPLFVINNIIGVMLHLTYFSTIILVVEILMETGNGASSL